MSFPADVRHVAFAGDWHADTGFARQVMASLPDHVEVLVHTGDFAGDLWLDEVLDEYQELAELVGVRLMFIDGNHENFGRLYATPVDDRLGVRVVRPAVWHLPRGFRWEWSGLTFLALGGATSMSKDWRTPGVDWWPDEAITDQDVELAVSGGRADVIVCHDTPPGHEPAGIHLSNEFPQERNDAADRNRDLIRQVVDAVRPRFMWHGHYHGRYEQIVGLGDSLLTINGLHCNESSYDQNIDVVDLAELSMSLATQAA